MSTYDGRPDTIEELSAEVVAARAALEQVKVDLEDAQRRLKLTLEVAGAAGNWEWDIGKDRLFGDARYAALTGQDPVALANGVPARAFFHAIHPDDRKRVQLSVAGILSGAEVFSKEYRLLKEDGGFRWVHADGRAVLDQADELVSFTGVLVDITEQKRTQEQLRIAQSSGGIGTFEYTDGYGTAIVSEQFCRLVGLHPTRVLPVRTINVLVHREDRPIIEPLLPSEPQPDRNVEFRITRADTGEQRWLARRGEYVPDLAGVGLRYIGVAYDITEAKRKEQLLREANAALAERVRERTRERNRVWRKSQDILAVIEPGGIVRDVNPAWTEILGHSSTEVIGQPLQNFIWAEDAGQQATIESALEQETANFDGRYTHSDGTPRWISWVISRDDDLTYAFGRHVTREKQQGEALREAEAQLRQSQKMEAVGQLTGGIAHDFNNLLTGIIGSLDILKRRIAAGRLDDVGRFMDAATTSAQRAAALTHRLLAFSRRQSLDRQPTDVAALVGSMKELLERTLGEQIRLVVASPADSWLAVTDANQLENAILNLAINARDAMPEGGVLTIELENVRLPRTAGRGGGESEAGKFLSLTVRDTGEGMSADVLEKAFDPFFTTKPIGQGTGLGLSMVYGFAEQSGGSVKIDSKVGGGTAVTLYLPRAETDGARPGGTDAALRAPRGDGETVLVVEDDAAVRLLVVEVLNDLGYVPLEATSADEAIPIFHSGASIDLMISDVGLPGLNGRQLAETAREVIPDLKVLFITGYAPTALTRGDFLGEGMEMITKPFDLKQLAQKIRDMLTVA